MSAPRACQGASMGWGGEEGGVDGWLRGVEVGATF